MPGGKKTRLIDSKKESKFYNLKMSFLKIIPEITLILLVMGTICMVFTTAYLKELNMANYKSSEYLIRTTVQNTLEGIVIQAEKYILNNNIDITREEGIENIGEYFMNELSTTNINARGFLYYQDIVEGQEGKYNIAFNRNFFYDSNDIKLISFLMINGDEIKKYINPENPEVCLLANIRENDLSLYSELIKLNITDGKDLKSLLSLLDRMKMMTSTEITEENWLVKDELKKYYRIAVLPISDKYYYDQYKVHRKIGFIITYDENDLWMKSKGFLKLASLIKGYFTGTIVLLFLVVGLLYYYNGLIKNIRLNRK